MLALLALLLAAWALIRAPAWPERAGAALAAIVALALLALPAWHVLAARSAPAIHDISTDLDHPPAFEAVLPLRAGAPNPPGHPGAEVAAIQRAAYPDILPLVLGLSPDVALARAERVARELGWTIVALDAESGRLEATDRTFWFGFTDDIVIRIRPADSGTRIDARSKSRIGGSDLGANAARLRAFLERMRQG